MDKRVLVAVGVGVGVMLLAIRAYGAGGRADAVMSRLKKPLTVTQRRMATIIAEEFLAAGLTVTAAAAAIANAWVESKLDSAASGDGGHSIGLFQLHDQGGGHGLTVEFRADPRNNTRTILQREVLAGFGKTFRKRMQEGAGVGELAAIFSRDIERPADKEGNMAIRQALAESMFPSLA